MKTACVFAHFDPSDEVDDHVIYFIGALRTVVDCLQFVTSSNLSTRDIKKLESLGVNIIHRDNKGYDFFSYKVGIAALALNQYDELILCNDSVYGPFYDLRKLFQDMRQKDGDFWGITESFDFSRHLQSYFLVFKRPVLQSATFREFWASLESLKNKKEIIRRYEIGLSQLLLNAGFSLYALVSYNDLDLGNRQHPSWSGYLKILRNRWSDPTFWPDVLRYFSGNLDISINPTHIQWKALLENHNAPFLKIALLRDNPKNLRDIDTALSVIQSLGNYPVRLISSHLRKTSGSQHPLS